MGYRIQTESLHYSVQDKKILAKINFRIDPGSFVALLGENGSGKSTLLDLLMGVRLPKNGKVTIEGKEPHKDDLNLKKNIIFLSEKMELPVYWKVKDYLSFHKYFYPNYSNELEEKLLKEYKITRDLSFRSLSAGENKRAQIVGALASRPQLLFVDEITAVLDIVGRLKFMSHLKELTNSGSTVVLATNILEDLNHYASHLLLLRKGQISFNGSMQDFMKQSPKALFSQQVSERLEAA